MEFYPEFKATRVEIVWSAGLPALVMPHFAIDKGGGSNPRTCLWDNSESVCWAVPWIPWNHCFQRFSSGFASFLDGGIDIECRYLGHLTMKIISFGRNMSRLKKVR
eukprot:scaffold1222_cov172-Ochromonas_danica.AAC.1